MHTQGLAWCHGLATTHVHHLRGILANTSNVQMVDPMLGEFESHKVHLSVFLEGLQPALSTRLLLLVTQVGMIK